MRSTSYRLAKQDLNPDIQHTHHKRDGPKYYDNRRRNDLHVRICCIKDRRPLTRIEDYPTCCNELVLDRIWMYKQAELESNKSLSAFGLEVKLLRPPETKRPIIYVSFAC